MDFTWTSIAAWLIRAGLGGSLLIVATLIAMRWVRQPARRQRLGELGMTAALVLAALCWAPAWLPLWEPAPAPAPRVAFMLLPVQEPPADFDAGAIPLALVAAKPSPAAPAALEQQQTQIDLLSWLLPAAVVAYGLGVAFYLVRWLAGVVALWRIVRAAQPATPDLLAAFHAGVRGGRRPRLLISSKLQVPASCGIVRPTVILPAHLAAPERSVERDWVFAHELTHLARRDAWSATLFAMGQMLYFILPWFWWLKRLVRLCQEYVADAAAVRQRPADEYAEFLLSLTKSPAAPLAATGVTGSTSDLYRRVAMLLENPVRVELSCPRSWTVGAAGILLGLAVVAAGVGPAQADPPNQKEVLEQLERIQEMVNKLRTQIAEQPKPEPARVTKPGVRVIEVDDPKIEIRLKTDDAKKALEQRQQALRALQRALAKQADAQKQAAEDQRSAAAHALALLGKPQDPKARVHDEHLKNIIELLRKQHADLKDTDKATKQVIQEAIDRLQDVLKKRAATEPKLLVEAFAFSPDGTLLSTTTKAAPQGRLGVRIEAPSAILAEQLNLPKDQGLVVSEVIDNSVAKKAGIKANDILLKINQQTVSNNPEALKPTIDGIKADTAFDIVVLRRGKQETVKDVKLPEPSVRIHTRVLGGTLPGAQIAITVRRTGNTITLHRNEGSLAITVQAELTGDKHQVSSISIAEKGKDAKYQKVEEVPEAHRAKVQHMLQLLDTPLRTPPGKGAERQPGGDVNLYYILPEAQQQPRSYTPRTIVAPLQPSKGKVVTAPTPPVGTPPSPRTDLERSLIQSLDLELAIPQRGVEKMARFIPG